jgi:hypothetical protein
MGSFAATLLRRQIVPHVVALGLFGIALGFAVATLKTALINHPVLRFAASPSAQARPAPRRPKAPARAPP